MKKLISAALLLSASAGFAGDKEGHGGGVVYVNGHAVLRDLVDPANCEWTPVSEVLEPLAHFPRILETVAVNHWYLADVLKRDSSKIESVCLTDGELKNITAKEDEELLTIHRSGTAQVAIRVKNTLYLSRPLFSALDPRNQAYTMVHEISHSLIAENAPQRSGKLASFVKTLMKNEEKPFSREKLAMQLKFNDIDVVGSTEALDGRRSEILAALDPGADLGVRRKAAKTLVSLALPLRAEDQATLSALSQGLDATLKAKVESGSASEVRAALDLGADPNCQTSKGLSCLTSAINRGDVEVVRALTEHPALNVKLRETSKRRIPGWDYSYDTEFVATPVNQAIDLGRADIAKVLLARPEVFEEAPSDTTQSALLGAIALKDDELVAQLAKHPQVIKHINKLFEQTQTTMSLPLVAAVERGSIAMLKALLAIPGIDVNRGHFVAQSVVYKAKFQACAQTALFVAIRDRKLDVAKLLLEVPGINPNVMTASCAYEQFPLSYAVNENDYESAKLLISHPATDPNVYWSWTHSNGTVKKHALRIAIEKKNLPMTKLLLSHPKIGLDLMDSDFEAAYTVAFKQGSREFIHAIVDAKAFQKEHVEFMFWDDPKGNCLNAFGLAILRNDRALVEKMLKIKGVTPETTAWREDGCSLRKGCPQILFSQGCWYEAVGGKPRSARTTARELDKDDLYKYLNSASAKKESCFWFICW